MMVISPPVTSLRPKLSSLHNRSYFAPYKSYFAPCEKLVKYCRELFVSMLELNWFWTYVSPDLFPNAASSRIRLHLVTRNISFDYFLQHEFLYVVIPQNPRYCTEGILEGVSLLILIVSLTTLQYTFMRVIGNVVPLLQPVIGWKLAMTTHHWNKKRKLLWRRWRQVSLTVFKESVCGNKLLWKFRVTSRKLMWDGETTFRKGYEFE